MSNIVIRSFSVNPFYAARQSAERRRPAQARYARLRQVPVNASPAPRLTSLYHFDVAGDSGRRDYPGNRGSTLLRDLLRCFQPNYVLDTMTGGGTCRDLLYIVKQRTAMTRPR